MKIAELMTRGARTCADTDSLESAAAIVSEHDCGAVPVTDAQGRAIGIVTDRDICIAAYTAKKPLSEIPVTAAISKYLVSAMLDEPVDAVAERMQAHQIRRIPVTDAEGGLVGIVSLADLARHEGVSPDAVARTLAAISQPHEITFPRSSVPPEQMPSEDTLPAAEAPRTPRARRRRGATIS